MHKLMTSQYLFVTYYNNSHIRSPFAFHKCEKGLEKIVDA